MEKLKRVPFGNELLFCQFVIFEKYLETFQKLLKYFLSVKV